MASFGSFNAFISVLPKPPWRDRRARRLRHEEVPLRSALFGLAQLERHAQLLAAGHEIDPNPAAERLLERLRANELVIREAYRAIAEAARERRPMAPASEWLLDNAYLIEEQIDVAREHLPPGYSRQLPRLRSGPLQGFPRVYDLALELVSHTDGRVDMENLSHFVRAYQTERPLALGELWAIAIMLRLALIESLRRVSARIVARHRHQERALEWAGRFLEVVHRQPKQLVMELADFARANETLPQPFLAELATGLQAEHPALQLVINWLEQDLAERGQTLEQIRQAESRDQAADRVSIGNGITSLRTLSGLDWHAFVESISVTEAALRRDPAGVYARMDFRTRDRYRHVVERLAARSRRPEHDVAAAAVALAAARREQPEAAAIEAHVGYFLIDRGVPELQRALGYAPSAPRRFARRLRAHAFGAYIGAIALLAVVLAAALLIPVASLAGWTWMGLVPTGLLLLLFTSQAAQTLVNWLVTIVVPARGLPRLDFAAGIPDEYRTVVAVPTLLASEAAVDDLVQHLEIRYLGNRSRNLSFALLTDFPDAAHETLPSDARVLERAVRGIEALNARYGEAGETIFCLLHRPRVWNPVEEVWMGYERKRGKLADFNRLLHGAPADRFAVTVGDLTLLRSARYVITLDTDTQLPPETAWKLVGALAHPLNRPRVHPATRCADQGYSVLQPRVAISLTGAGRSLFARLYAGEVGVDPYTREVSNVLHDLLGQCGFIGKGIYDAAAFEAAVGERFPPNRILSHDLIEGCHARCGFLNDVELIEEHPSGYLADMERRHRWVRGDWQIGAWLLPYAPGHEGRRVRNVLPALARWQIFDNLRRSLVPAALLALLLIGWLALPHAAAGWTLGLAAVYFAPTVLRALHALLYKPGKVFWGAHLGRTGRKEGRQALIDLLHLIFLPFEVYVNLDAVTRAVWRVHVSRRRLLEWRTAHDAEGAARTDPRATYRRMASAPAAAVLSGVATAIANPGALPAAAPFLLAWLAAPAIAWLISQPLAPRQAALAADQTLLLRRIARRTWMYFEQFVTAEQNWLPPDNFQEIPEGRTADRTSPTNIGLGLLSTLAAHDFGYLPTAVLVHRVENTFATLDRLPRYRGHLYNWYDTRRAEPLHPVYISTVDSANFAAALIALRGGLRELLQRAIVPERWREGLEDVGFILLEEIGRALAHARAPQARRDLQAIQRVVQGELRDVPGTPGTLPDIDAMLLRLRGTLGPLAPPAEHGGEVTFWLAALRRQVEALREDLHAQAPWLADTYPGQAGERFERLPVEAAKALEALRADLARVPTPAELAGLALRLGPRLDAVLEQAAATPGPLAVYLRTLREAVIEASRRAADRIRALDDLALRCEEMADLDLDFLYDPARKLLSIGYSLAAHARDPSHYDLLASEARVASYLGVAQDKLPQEHWFVLGRQLTGSDGRPSLMSWSGSMFEYLMPLLVMPTYEGTLLDEACVGAVRRQMRHGQRHRVPWGVSESCYNQLDQQMNYQYRGFGVPELGFKRGLDDDLVIAPYAAALALLVAPREACANLQAMARQGFVGRFGLYEAIDYTPSRVPARQGHALVRAFMAHHSGMSLLALAHALLERPMQRRWLADPELRASILLLQERVPLARPSTRQEHRLTPPAVGREGGLEAPAPVMRILRDPDTPLPEVHLLSNGRYHVMVTQAGAGFSRWQNLALTRWREDMTRDALGFFFYLQEVQSRQVLPCTVQPLRVRPDRYEAIFSQARAEFRTRHRGIDVYTQIAVSPEDDLELRRLTITNTTDELRTLELTSYGEVALAEPRAELAHPVFNGLFIQTELLSEKAAILCTRRPRASDEAPPWLFHAVIVHDAAEAQPTSFETSRARFLGRNRPLAHPEALRAPGPLANTAGAVLDPSLSIRRRFSLAPDEAVTVDAILGIGLTRADAVTLVDKYRDRRIADRVFELAWTHSQVLLHQLRATEADAQLFERFASAIVFANARYRANASLLGRNRKGQSDLWRFGISGDLPIVLVRVTEGAGLDLVRQVLQAYAYWRHKGLRVDLVIWADAFAGYRQTLVDQIMGLVNTAPEVKALDQPGGIFVRSSDQLPEDDRLLLQAVARVVLYDRGGSLAEQAARRIRGEPAIPLLRPTRSPEIPAPGETDLPWRELRFYNGTGGFTPDGREYVITTQPGRFPFAEMRHTLMSGELQIRHGDRPVATPAPWANVLANAGFGSVVTESGGAYTWFENAHLYRLTPWYNDPLRDTSGEAFYIRDEETGRFWSPTPLPAPGQAPYVCRHGLGYSAWEHTQEGLFTEMLASVPLDAPVKITLLTLRNVSDRERRLSVTGFCEWVLGEHRGPNAAHVVTCTDPQTGAIFAGNPFGTDHADWIGFFQSSEFERSLTADRTEFLGRNGSYAAPAAMRRQRLSNRVGAGLDPCAAIQSYLTIPPGQERQVAFVLGAAHSAGEALGLLARFSDPHGARHALQAVWETWKHLLGGVHVETPDPSVNFLVNYWLPYQTLAARYWARSGYYQSGGAYGFRDQLQDALAFLQGCPWLTREQLVRAAGRQFREGDVQHWWHPPSGRGVRTRFSDDYLWLPYVACRYVEAIGDTGVLDEEIPFLEGRPLAPGEDSCYDLPHASDQRVSLYEHCVRAIRFALKFGPHGLPLIGGGDWNDGMNRVGLGGQGESVWLAFFLYDVLEGFAPLASRRGDEAFARECLAAAETLRAAIETAAWDGRWYRRAYFDEGQPLGSEANIECRIDSLPQSWAVLSGAADPERARTAMASAVEHLVDWDQRLIRLFTPPFDATPLDPGYIKGYVPGVRENGGQYTHAAVWVVMAMAALRDADMAWRLFSLINPITHGDAPEAIERYKVEPYVVAADVYTAAGHEGRGGWTWYTGSAAWMYRLLVEQFLGLRLQVDTLSLAPLLPADWPELTIHYRYRGTTWHIHVKRVGPETWNVRRLVADGVEQADGRIHLEDDHAEHFAEAEVG